LLFVSLGSYARREKLTMDIGLAILAGILITLIMIYLSTRSIVEVLNYWGIRQNDKLKDILTKLEQQERD